MFSDSYGVPGCCIANFGFKSTIKGFSKIMHSYLLSNALQGSVQPNSAEQNIEPILSLNNIETGGFQAEALGRQKFL